MFRPILPVIICLSGPLNAQDDKGCPSGDPEHTCDHIVACIGTSGLWFNGRARGNGPIDQIHGALNTGATCTGTRMNYNKMFAGEITLQCTDGTRTTVDYDQPRLGNDFDYGYGQSVTQDGREVQVWLANDIVTILRRESGGIASLLPCVGGAVRLD